MRATHIATLACSLALTSAAAASPPKSTSPQEPALSKQQLAAESFGADAPWFLRNIPFLEIDDPEIQQIYYYRWKLFRSHIREIGSQGTNVTEFLEDVPWARHPYTDLNDSASFHILEGRWLRDPTVVRSLIDHLYSGAGNDRHFSESIAAATEGSTRVTGDPAPALRHLDTMQHIFNLWDDHFDRARNLYWIEPLLDATEYTIASIDASGAGFTDQPSPDQNRNGFTGGHAFRPSINSYQYANALAIARFADLSGQPALAADYIQRAANIRSAVLSQLWNPVLEHFTDRYQRSTKYVTAGDFIRGRELVGYLPWFYDLPPLPAANTPLSPDYAAAWQHLLAPSQLGGPYGLRTVEPSYPRYLAQYRYDQPTGQPECQWNGPSWPFQTSQALTALANLLDDYPQSKLPHRITPDDYVRLLRQYTHQHLLSPGHPDIQEDYNPDTGKPIVGLTRSHHYNHSTYVDLVLSGLIGIRPRADELLEVSPLLPSLRPAHPGQLDTERPIRYFALAGLAYHGHQVTIIYDSDGRRYGIGPGLSVFVDHKLVSGPAPVARVLVKLHVVPRKPGDAKRQPIDLAVNPGVPGGPVASASSSISPSAVAEAIDGRLWFFPENPNGWSPAPSDKALECWYAVDLRQSQTISAIALYFSSDGRNTQPPATFQLQYQTPAGWQIIPSQHRTPSSPLANGENRITFPPLSIRALRIVLPTPPPQTTIRLIELKAFAPHNSGAPIFPSTRSMHP